MKILIVNTSDVQGGAARAAYRLHKSLLVQNIDSQMLVQDKSSDDFTVFTQDKKTVKYWNKLRWAIDGILVGRYKDRTKTTFSPSWMGLSNIVDKINEIKPDIVHLHWVCRDMIRIEDLTKIKAPIVWSLHDMWPFTGGCHYDEECGLYEKSCGSCKVLGSTSETDLSKRVFNRKKKSFLKIDDMTIIGLSKWLSDCAKKSTLLKDKKHIHLPNPIDTNIFKPFDKVKSRELWNLPQNKKLILFGAIGVTSDPRKGFDELKSALQKIEKTELELVIYGCSEPKQSQEFGLKTHYLGTLIDDVSLVTLYNAVDVMVVPSLQENLSNVIMESLSCATPVVGFEIGGNSDMVEHKRTGYLVKPFDANDLACGMEWVLNNEDYDKLCQNAREKVVREFDSEIVAKKYIELYEEILKND